MYSGNDQIPVCILEVVVLNTSTAYALALLTWRLVGLGKQGHMSSTLLVGLLTENTLPKFGALLSLVLSMWKLTFPALLQLSAVVRKASLIFQGCLRRMMMGERCLMVPPF